MDLNRSQIDPKMASKGLENGIARFGDAVSATPVRRWDDSVTGRFGDGRFGDGTFRRRDISAIGRFGDGKFRRWDFSVTKKSCVQ